MTHPLRIVLVGQSGPYAPPVLRRLIDDPGPWRIVGVVEGRRRGSGGPLHRRVSPRGRPMPVGNNLTAVASALGITALQTRDINDPAAVDFIDSLEADLLLCAGFDRLFKPAVLEAVSWGGINIHPSTLPEWRGPAPLFWAIREGRRRIGVTIHGLDPREDHGPIYAHDAFERRPRMSGESLYGAAVATAFPMLRRVLQKLNAGTLVGTSQDETQATRAPRPTPDDARIEPGRWECEHLVDFACAATFFCMPWMQLGGDRFHIARGVSAEPNATLPGEFVQKGTSLIVQCRNGVAHLELLR